MIESGLLERFIRQLIHEFLEESLLSRQQCRRSVVGGLVWRKSNFSGTESVEGKRIKSKWGPEVNEWR